MQESQSRWFKTAAILCVLFLALEVRLFHLQIVKHARAEESVDSVVRGSETLLAGRGSILDRNGVILAESVPALDIYADARWTDGSRRDGTVRARLIRTLAEVGLGSEDALRSALERPGYRRLFRAPVTEGEQIVRLLELDRAKELPGIDLQRTYARRYPEGRSAAQLIGYVDAEGHGRGGLEQAYDEQLRGGDVVRSFGYDAARRTVVDADSVMRRARQGATLQTTIDATIQFHAEKQLEAIVEKYHPRWATAIVLRPATGEVLAVANQPTFDPNRYANFEVEAMRNNAVTLTYAPGSSFKPFIMGMCLDEAKVRLGERIDCENGVWNLGYRTIEDVHPYELLTPGEIIAHSSNIGIVKLAMRLAPDDNAPKESQLAAFKAIRNRLNDLGFGHPTGVGLPGESGGVLTPLKRWTRRYTLVSLAFGYEIQVTPMQLATAFNVYANGGRWIQPRLVRDPQEVAFDAAGTGGATGAIERPWQAENSVFDPVTARQVTTMLMAVVEEGTAQACGLNGYSMAGKTSTAQYERPPRRYTSSFVGFAPASAPELLALVVVDQPKGEHYGAIVAAPAVREILQSSLEYLRVAPDRPYDVVADRSMGR